MPARIASATASRARGTGPQFAGVDPVRHAHHEVAVGLHLLDRAVDDGTEHPVDETSDEPGEVGPGAWQPETMVPDAGGASTPPTMNCATLTVACTIACRRSSGQPPAAPGRPTPKQSRRRVAGQ